MAWAEARNVLIVVLLGHFGNWSYIISCSNNESCIL